ncbi:multiheme c-type cytochrome [Alteromonas stellipolaris]|uniref:multiheme c-type cytochrome n=1 Tax=Alteromonas stellipolaris TaxID=233316 RepID=UPI001D23AFD0|nr:multiheme c-type cytochrome [Alteromonas stellipolaris]MBZ2163491.1 hypothetical protein [Alteromonas stellipolaris]
MNNTTSTSQLLMREKRQNRWLYSMLVVLLLSGLYSYISSSHSVFSQWLVLAHGFIGTASLLLLVPFIINHFYRTLGQRRAGLFTSGIFLFVLSIVMGFTGVYIIVAGLTEQTAWLLNIHIASGFSLFGVLIFHVISHYIWLAPKRRASLARSKEQNFRYFPSLEEQSFLRIGTFALGFFTITFSLSLIYLAFEIEPSNQPAVTDYQYNYGPHPFRPSQTDTASGTFIDKNQIAGSQNCANCHKEIAEQWYSSIHKQAASDPTYVKNITLLSENKGIEATRYCEGCHAPVALLTGQLSEGGTHGGIKNTTAFHEGISCLSCHNIESATHLKGVASYRYEPHKPYLFDGYESKFFSALREYLIRINPSQHKTDMAKDILIEPELCATCHVQFMDKEMNNWGWVKMQDEYTAWLESPYSMQSEQVFAHSKKTRCQDCHMPMVKGNDPSANSEGEFRSHRFIGANTMLPSLNGDKEQLAQTQKFLQSNKVRLTINPPNRKDATQSDKQITEDIRAITETPAYFYLNETVKLNVVAANIGVGHNFPAGTLDINEAWIAFTALDATGKVIYQSGFLEDDLSVETNAYFYRSLPIDRFGKLVWKHDLFNRVGETYKNFIPAGGSDIVEYTFDVPSWAKGPITLNAVLKYRKLNQRYAKWALGEDYQDLPITDMARATILVPLREQPPVRMESASSSFLNNTEIEAN